MSLTARRMPAGGSSMRVMKTCSSDRSAPATTASVGPLEAGAGHLALDHLAEELLDLAVPGDLDVTVLVGLAPVGERPPLREAVELGPRDRELQAGALGLALRDDRSGEPDAEDLDVTAAPQLEAHRELQVAERWHLGREPPVSGRDELLRARHLRPVALEQLLADHHLLDLGRALADQEQRRVAVDALDLVLLRVAVAAVDPQGLLGVRLRRLGGE